MAITLSDGTVIPHYLSVKNTSVADGLGMDGDSFLKIGEVKRIVWPGSKEAREGQRFIEYDVLAEFNDNDSLVGGGRLYPNCSTIDSFGGLADLTNWTYREDPTIPKSDPNNNLVPGYGSKVILLCVGGKTTRPLIIGGVRDGQDKSETKKTAADLGHHLHWVFNGIDIFINDSGELTLTYKGKTKNDGTLDDSVDKDKAGTYIKLLKDGTVSIVGKGVNIGDATDKWLLASTYRDAETQMNTSLQTQLATLTSQLKTVATLLNTAGSGMSTPVTGAVAAGPQIVTAAQTLLQAADTTNQMSQSISQFEQDKDKYLSKKNKND